MSGAFKAVPVAEHVHWVGAIDWNIREFHGYATHRGTTYNAFLVTADRVTLIDTVKAPFRDEMMSRIASVVDPGAIDLIVSNHSEMDHSGCLPQTIEAVRPAKVVASAHGVKNLDAHFRLGERVEAIEDGGSVDLGTMNLTFLETKMLHWPDSMVSYLPQEQVLFSQDAFGQHLATRRLWADENPAAVLHEEAEKYYANILMPYAPLVAKTVAKLGEMDLPMAVLAPDHGPLYRRDFDWIVGRYAAWSDSPPSRKAVVVYDTMWQSDTLMARAVAEGLADAGAGPVQVLSMHSAHRSDVATEVLEAGALVVGSPTLNQNLYPTMSDVLSYLHGLKRRGLVGACFGSYGWSSGAVRQLEEWLEKMKIDRVADSVSVNFVPDDAALAACRDLGRTVAEAMAAKATGQVRDASGPGPAGPLSS